MKTVDQTLAARDARRARRAPGPAFFAVLLASSGAACSFNFQNADQVVDRRVLAIRADPPELVSSLAPPAQLDLRPLVVDPTEPQATVAYEWRACTPAGLAGPGAQRQLLGASAPVSDVTSGRCDESTPANLLASGTATLDSLDLQAPVPDLSQLGDALRFQLKVSGSSGDLYAFKDVTLTSDLPPGQQPNQNPVLTGIQLDGAAIVGPGGSVAVAFGSCSADRQKTVTDSATGQKATVCSHTLLPVFDGSQSESYLDTSDASAGPVQTRERLRFAFFCDRGSFTQGSTAQALSSAGLSSAGIQTEWEEPVAPAAVTTLWIVTRDGRGGESWMEMQITAQ